MRIWEFVALLGHAAGMVAFGGGLLYFKLLFKYADRVRRFSPLPALDDAFRVTSLATSVGLTLLIFSGLLSRVLHAGEFRWSLATDAEMLSAVKAALFLLQWGTWGWLEVVVLHPFRLHLAQPDPLEVPGYQATRARVSRALSFQLALFSLILVLSAATQVALS